MERKFLKYFPRRSPQLLGRSTRNGSSTSMHDLNLLGSNKLCDKIKHKPKIKTSTCENSMNEKGNRSLKRMRDSTLSLRSIENVMPTPMKRLKSSSLNYPVEQVATETKVELVKKKFASRVASFAKGFSPRRSFRKKSEEDLGFERSSSLRFSRNGSPFNSISQSSCKKYKDVKAGTPTRRRDSKLWVDTVACLDSDIDWTPQQIKRQEAIYELYCSEIDLIEDLKLLKEVYFNPMSKLKLLSDDDLETIFGSIQVLLPLHEDLVKNLEEARISNGSIHQVGQILMSWIPTLRPYLPYCSNQLHMKEALTQKLKEKSFSDFLQRCLESPFSRKLDLWSFLDSPRSKLVKYPLLLSNIHKYTPKDHPDRPILYRTTKQLETLIKEADREAGISKCLYYKERLSFPDEECKSICDEVETLLCHGCLKSKSGNKVEAFLFNTVFVCTRLAMRNGSKSYQVIANPIPVNDMEVDDLSDGEVRLGGSFRTTISKGPAAKYAFRVSTKEFVRGKSIILQANDQHDKKQWLNKFHSIIPQQQYDSDSNEKVDQLLPEKESSTLAFV